METKSIGTDQKNNERASIKIYSDAKNNLAILAKRSGKSEIDYLSMGINFIYQSGLDVYAETLPNVPDLVKNLERRIIGFMKKREQDFFVPMNNKVQVLIENHVKVFDSLNALDVVDYSIRKESAAKEKYSVPDKEDEEIELQVREAPKYQSQEKEDKILDELRGSQQKIERQRDLFKGELDFIMKRLKRSGALTGGKFVANITQRDYERIQKILNDN